MTRIILNGCLGRMGKAIRELAEKETECEIAAGIYIEKSDNGVTFPLYSDIAHCEMPADVILDFSHPDALLDLLRYAEGKNIPLVTGTTGLTQVHTEAVKKASEKVAILHSANMSLGINLIANIMKRTAKLLYDAHFDIEIIEKHHSQKLDAPSGTALMLAGTAKDALGGGVPYVYDRTARRETRPKHEIGLHAIRGGSIVGEHTVLFAGQDEVIEFNHRAQSRAVFAAGALKAAVFIKTQPPGLYSMQDLIDTLAASL